MAVSVNSTIHKATSQIAKTPVYSAIYTVISKQKKDHFIKRSHNLPTDLEGNLCCVSTRKTKWAEAFINLAAQLFILFRIFQHPMLCK